MTCGRRRGARLRMCGAMERREGSLGGDQVIELPGLETAVPDQLLGAPRKPGLDDGAVIVRDPPSDRPARAPTTALKREEPDDRFVVVQHADVDVVPEGLQDLPTA